MSETDKKKTVFVTPHRGLYHFNVMPFGLRNTQESFQRIMEKGTVWFVTPKMTILFGWMIL